MNPNKAGLWLLGALVTIITCCIVSLALLGCSGIQRGGVNVVLGYDKDDKPITGRRLLDVTKENHKLGQDRARQIDKRAEDAEAQAIALRAEHAKAVESAKFRQTVIEVLMGVLSLIAVWNKSKLKQAQAA